MVAPSHRDIDQGMDTTTYGTVEKREFTYSFNSQITDYSYQTQQNIQITSHSSHTTLTSLAQITPLVVGEDPLRVSRSLFLSSALFLLNLPNRAKTITHKHAHLLMHNSTITIKLTEKYRWARPLSSLLHYHLVSLSHSQITSQITCCNSLTLSLSLAHSHIDQ